jgi:hypothetical protein
MPKKKSEDPKLQARLKVRPDEPVEETRIYLNMPKKKAPVKKKTVAKKAPAKKTTKKGKK